jgi:purine-nucleoside phosphorylase
MSGTEDKVAKPSDSLNEALKQSAKKQGIELKAGPIHTCDIFYRQPWQGEDPPYWKILFKEQGIVAVEMEAFALFHNAKATGKNAACLLTISDSLVTWEMTTAEERQNSFLQMLKIALEVL